MLEIKLNLDREETLACCLKCERGYSQAFYLYQAVDRGEVLATGLFEVGGEAVRAVWYESREADDAWLMDGVLRAGLNYAASQGIEMGILPEELRAAHRPLFEQLNYPAETCFNIVNFFQKYKSCRPGR